MKLLKEPKGLDTSGKMILAIMKLDQVFRERSYLKDPQVVLEEGLVSFKSRQTACTQWVFARLKEELPFFNVSLHDIGGESERIEIDTRGSNQGSPDRGREGGEAGGVRLDSMGLSVGGSESV